MKNLFARFVREEAGQDLIEYALLAALVALGSTIAMNTLSGNISTALGNVGTALVGATNP